VTNVYKIEDVTIMEIQKAFKKNLLTSKELVMMYLERISKLNQNGPKVNAVLEINPDAIQIAEALDYERMTKGSRGNLHGIPVLIKDNIDTADKMHTSAGSLALKDSYAKEDAFLIKQIRKAGGVILGKTNMTEWANFMTEGMPAGYSSRGGQVLSPYGLESLNPGGSSSGSGVAVTYNFCTVAIGTETSGSIINPCCDNGIVGIKPTIGLISRAGIIPASHMQDTAGPMGRTVEDVAILLGGMIGYDKNDPITLISQEKSCIDYTQFLTLNGLEGVRLGVPKDYFFDGLTEEEVTIVQDMLKIMKQQGACIIDNIKIPLVKELQSKTALLYEFKADINAYLSKLDYNVPIHSLSELIHFNQTHSEKMLKYGQSYLTAAEETLGTLTELDYIKNRLKDLKLSKEGIDQVMLEHNLDAFVFPSYKAAVIVDKAGYPSITVPAGLLQDGKPFGITFTAEAFSEPKLIKLAYALEQHTKKRTAPGQWTA